MLQIRGIEIAADIRCKKRLLQKRQNKIAAENAG
jgi:hypothetical protein